MVGRDNPRVTPGVIILAGSKPRARSPAVPWMCPKQQSATVAHGQQRSLPEVAGLGHRWMASSPTVLPKLAVFRPVRAGSVPQRSSRGSSGRQRPPTVQRNRRSPALQLTQQGRWTRVIRIVVPKVGFASLGLSWCGSRPQHSISAVGDQSKDKHDDQACTHKSEEDCCPTQEVIQKLDMRAARQVELVTDVIELDA